MTQDGKPPPDFPHGPDEVRDLEAQCPNTVRFFRELIKGGTQEAQGAQKHVQEHVELESMVMLALEGRLPAGMILMVLTELLTPQFKMGVRRCTYEPIESEVHESAREYIKNYFAKVKGVHFDYKVPDAPE